ncbi:hypothetical protein F2P81_000444 [Scophthalmus maximus]|uniref:Uncharacterized protein n=1 Tax=Scophthalmus maximus TaxID=52904 RepID=A0A6A4TW23_SCOMX|nr:hypothetical protein F2P81_000444 [Scophthalmus maximus]
MLSIINPTGFECGINAASISCEDVELGVEFRTLSSLKVDDSHLCHAVFPKYRPASLGNSRVRPKDDVRTETSGDMNLTSLIREKAKKQTLCLLQKNQLSDLCSEIAPSAVVDEVNQAATTKTGQQQQRQRQQRRRTEGFIVRPFLGTTACVFHCNTSPSPGRHLEQQLKSQTSQSSLEKTRFGSLSALFLRFATHHCGTLNKWLIQLLRRQRPDVLKHTSCSKWTFGCKQIQLVFSVPAPDIKL